MEREVHENVFLFLQLVSLLFVELAHHCADLLQPPLNGRHLGSTFVMYSETLRWSRKISRWQKRPQQIVRWHKRPELISPPISPSLPQGQKTPKVWIHFSSLDIFRFAHLRCLSAGKDEKETIVVIMVIIYIYRDGESDLAGEAAEGPASLTVKLQQMCVVPGH